MILTIAQIRLRRTLARHARLAHERLDLIHRLADAKRRRPVRP